jgi:hypothetical protein
MAVDRRNLEDVQVCGAIQPPQSCQALGRRCQQPPSRSNWIRGDMGDKMVAKLTIYIPIVGGRGKCSAGSGPWKEGRSRVVTQFSKAACKMHDIQQTGG